MMKMLNITLVRSPIGYPKKVRSILLALGLHKLHSSTIKPDEPSVQGMIRKVGHLLEVVPAGEQEGK
jgi:large subunit ribosomal protein L30